MRTKVFVGLTTAEALERVREQIGADAVVLAMRDTESGVEITAMESVRTPPTMTTLPRVQSDTDIQNANIETAQYLHSLVENLKELLKNNIAPISWHSIRANSGELASSLRTLLQAGFSTQLCGELANDLQQQSSIGEGISSKADLRTLLMKQLFALDPFSVFDEGGIFPIVGATGVGKTTLIAKIAARCIVRYGRENISVLSTDNFRIGARDQLETYSRIVNLPVISIRNAHELEAYIQASSTKKITLIDTAGTSQRDIQLLEQIRLISTHLSTSKTLLVLSATLNRNTIEDVILMYQRALARQHGRIFAAVITKTDEAAQLGPVLDGVIRYKIPLLFLSNGQRVPEDLSLADTGYLVGRALQPRRVTSELEIEEEMIPAFLTNQLTQWSG